MYWVGLGKKLFMVAFGLETVLCYGRYQAITCRSNAVEQYVAFFRRNSGSAEVGAADPPGVAVRAARGDRGRRGGLRFGAAHGADDGGGRRRVRRAVAEAEGRGGALVQGD